MILPKSSLAYLYKLDFNGTLYTSTVKEMVAQRDYASLLEVIKFMEGNDLSDRHRLETKYSLMDALFPSVREEHYGPNSNERSSYKMLAWSKSAEDFFTRMLSLAKKEPLSFVNQVCCILDAALKFQVDGLIAPAMSVLKKQNIERAGIMLIGAWANDASMRYLDSLEAKGKLTADVRLGMIEGHLSRRMEENWGRSTNADFLARCFTTGMEESIPDRDEDMPYILEQALRRASVPFFESFAGLIREQQPVADFRTGQRETILMMLNKHFVTGQLRFAEWENGFRCLTSTQVGLDADEVVDGSSALMVLANARLDSGSDPKVPSEDQLRLAIVATLEAGADPHRKLPALAGDSEFSVIEAVSADFPERAQIMRAWVVKDRIQRVAAGARAKP